MKLQKPKTYCAVDTRKSAARHMIIASVATTMILTAIAKFERLVLVMMMRTVLQDFARNQANA